MSVFEKEGDGALDGKWYEHLDRNWKNGNDGFDAVNKRIDNVGTIIGDGTTDNQSVLIDANGKKWGSLSGRLDNDQTTGETALELVQDKADRDYVENYLKQISFIPETFAKLEYLKNTYPNGRAGIFIVADTGHKYIWANNQWTDAGVYQSVGLVDESVTSDKLAYNVKNGDLISWGVEVDFEEKKLIVKHAVQVATNTESFSLSGNDIIIPLDPNNTEATGFFISFSTVDKSIQINTDIRNTPQANIYLGWIDIIGKNYNIHASNVVDSNLGNVEKNFVIASRFPVIIDIGNRTLSVPQKGYCNLFFADGQSINLQTNNKTPVSMVSGNNPTNDSSFIFVDELTGRLSGSSSAIPQGKQDLIGWVTWTSPKGENELSGLKTEVVNIPTKVSVGGLDGVAIGDSITRSYNTTKWTGIVNEMENLNSMQNLGIAGATYAVRGGREDSAVDKIDVVKGDLILIAYGINDFHSNVRLGEFNSDDTGSFYGALEYVYSTVITNNPAARILVITPMKQHGYNEAPDSYTKNKQGLLQVDYINAIKEVAGKYSLPVIDLFNNAGMSPFNEAQASQYFRDGLHPNQAGEYVYARKVVEAINSLS